MLPDRNNRIRWFRNGTIFKQLYNGELYPYSKFQTTIEDFKVNRDKAFKSYSVFIEKLPDELKDEFDELIDSHLDLLPLELEQNFIDGFRIGVRMMTEIYAALLDEEEHS